MSDRLREREPCPDCGCPGERYDGHACDEYWQERAEKAEAERDALAAALQRLRESIEFDAAKSAYDAGLGVSVNAREADFLRRIQRHLRNGHTLTYEDACGLWRIGQFESLIDGQIGTPNPHTGKVSTRR